jgi:hypothetical protein
MTKKGTMCPFKSYYMPTLTHKAEIWPWTTADISRITVAEMRLSRSIQEKTKREKIRNKLDII